MLASLSSLSLLHPHPAADSAPAESFTRLQDVVTGRALCHRGLESDPRISPDTQVLPAADRAARVLAASPPLGCSAPLSLCGPGPASPPLRGHPHTLVLCNDLREGHYLNIKQSLECLGSRQAPESKKKKEHFKAH